MSLASRFFLPALCLLGLSVSPVAAQDRVLSFSVTGGAQVAPRYFGSNDLRIGPSGAVGFQGLRFGSVQLGDPDGPKLFAPGTELRGAFRFIPKREGARELQGMDDVKASFEVGLRAQHAAENWQVFTDLRYGVIGHKAIAGEVGANLIYRGANGFVLHGGPRAEFGNSRFARSYFGVTAAEANATGPNLTQFTPSGGFHSIGLELGAYQPLSDDWGVTGSLRFDRLRGGAAASPIVQQGRRDQVSAQIGLTRHFNLRF